MDNEPEVQVEQEAVEPSVEELKGEIDRKEAEIKRLQGVTKDLQRRGVPRQELEALNRRLDGMEESQADLKDYLIDHLGEGEEKPTRKTERQRLEERRKSQPVDGEVQRFISYVDSLGLAHDDELVEEAVADDRTPNEALKYLRGKMNEKSQEAIDKQIADSVRLGVEQELKKRGMTTSGSETPSAPGGKTFTAKQIENMSVREYAENKAAIDEAQRLGKIKS